MSLSQVSYDPLGTGVTEDIGKQTHACKHIDVLHSVILHLVKQKRSRGSELGERGNTTVVVGCTTAGSST